MGIIAIILYVIYFYVSSAMQYRLKLMPSDNLHKNLG